MLAVKPLNNKEVFRFAASLPLQISHRMARRHIELTVPADPCIGRTSEILKSAHHNPAGTVDSALESV